MASLYPLRLERKLDRRLWGGQRLAAWLHLPQPWPVDLAESWQIYAENRVSNGPLAGRTLAEISQEFGPALLGQRSLPRYGHDFPLLAKFLDANDKLSIQVHPDDAYAHTVEAHTGFHGKTEAWHILAAAPGAQVIYGLNRVSSREEFAAAVADGALESLLNYVPVQAGDVLFVPAGTLHAIDAGIMLFEIQQKSDLTYRVYDYNRRDSAGALRQLHLHKALQVIDYTPPGQGAIPPLALGPGHDLLVACPYFALERLRVDFGELSQAAAAQTWRTAPGTFEIWTLIEGAAALAGETLRPGDSLLLPASLGDYEISPDRATTLLRCTVPDLAAGLLPALQAAGHSPAAIARTVMAS